MLNFLLMWSVVGYLSVTGLAWAWYFGKAPKWFDDDTLKAPIVLVGGPIIWALCLWWWIEIYVFGIER